MNRNPYQRRGRAVKHESGKIVTVEAAQTTLPAPTTGADGVSVEEWADQDGMMPDEADLLVSAANTVTLSNAVLYEYIDSVWYGRPVLNGGTDITLTATRGFKCPADQIVGTRVALGGTLGAVVAVTAKLAPKKIVSD